MDKDLQFWYILIEDLLVLSDIKCSDIGDGWGPTLVETQEEYDFIRHVADHDPFLGGHDDPGTVQAYTLSPLTTLTTDLSSKQVIYIIMNKYMMTAMLYRNTCVNK